MLLFRSEEHVERWSRSRNIAKGAVFSIAQLWGLATAWYGERIEPDWRRRTAEEAEEVFSSLGLVGEFWRLT